LIKLSKTLITPSTDDDLILAIKTAPKHTISDLDVSEAEFIESSTAAELDASLALTASPGNDYYIFLLINDFL
jgi:hypothetical protein